MYELSFMTCIFRIFEILFFAPATQNLHVYVVLSCPCYKSNVMLKYDAPEYMQGVQTNRFQKFTFRVTKFYKD